MTLTLRAFAPDDDDALISWLRTPQELVLFTGPKLTWPLTADQLDALRATPEFVPFTAVDDGGVVVGHIELVMTGEGEARMARVLVDPAQRGRGLGRLLVEALIAAARERGIRVLSLFVFPDNLPAVTLYESLGFEHRGASELLARSVLMELVL